MSLSSVVTGHDVEILLGQESLRHVIQLFMDIGDLPEQVAGGGVTYPVTAWADARRTYEPLAGFAYGAEGADALAVTVHDFSTEDSEHVYLSVRIDSLLDLDLYFRIQKTLVLEDVAASLFGAIAGERDENGDPIAFDFLELVRADAVLAAGATYDHTAANGGTPALLQPILDEINNALSGFGDALVAGQHGEIVDFLERQLDPLGPVTLERACFAPFAADDTLGIYLDFNLLDPDGGHLAPRGDSDSGENFLPSGSSFALGSSPDFLVRLVETAVVKVVLAHRVEEGSLTEAEALEEMEGTLFPLEVPDSLLLGEKENSEGEGVPPDTVVAFEVKRIVLDTTNHTFKDREGNKTRAQSLKVSIKTNESLWNAIGLADENLVAFLTPLEKDVLGVTVADVGIDTNLRLDVASTLLGALVTLLVDTLLLPGYALKLLLIPIVGLINLFANKPLDETYSGSLSDDFGIDVLSWLPMATRRWDPFYETAHGLLIERDELLFEDERLFLAGTVHLSKRVAPFERVYVRDVELSPSRQAVDGLLYKVESVSSILESDAYATDREPSDKVDGDVEANIYRLPFRGDTGTGSAADRLERDRLAAYLPYSPYCITPDSETEENEHDYAIDRIGMLSWEEVDDIEARLEREWVETAIDAILDALEGSLGAEIPDDMRDALQQSLEETIRDTHEFEAYVENDLPGDLEDEIFAEGTLRLRPAPSIVAELRAARVLDLVGYESVNREGRYYMRDIADDSEADNLLELPRCPS